MKKIYIALILLFGFLAFVPQIAVGDIPSYPRRSDVFNLDKALLNRQLKDISERKNEFLCLYRKKLALPQVYDGPNLQLLPYDIGELFGSVTELGYYGRSIMWTSNILQNECRDIIIYREEKNKYSTDLASLNYYDVTDVPPGSYLKFIPETKEMEVWSPRDNYYRQFLQNKIEKINNSTKEVEELLNSDDLELLSAKLEELNMNFIRSASPRFFSNGSEEEFLKNFISPKEKIKTNDIPYEDLKYSVKVSDKEKTKTQKEQILGQKENIKNTEGEKNILLNVFIILLVVFVIAIFIKIIKWKLSI